MYNDKQDVQDNEQDLDVLSGGVNENVQERVISELKQSPSMVTGGACLREEEEPDKKKKRIIIFFMSLILCLLMLLLLHQAGFIQFPWEKTPAAPIVAGDLFPGLGDAQSGTLSNLSKEDILEQMQMAADENYFSFKINTLLVFENGKSEAEMGIENPNYNVYPMVVQIQLGKDGAGERIYDSGGILPDYHIDRAKLSKELPKGTYEALAYLYAYDPNTQVNVFKSTAALTIIVNG